MAMGFCQRPVTMQEFLIHEGIWLSQIRRPVPVWEGEFEEQDSIWLRWCDRNGQVILTGAEGREIERQRADRLAERLRVMGINPDEI
jgi:hypothetical protein